MNAVQAWCPDVHFHTARPMLSFPCWMQNWDCLPDTKHSAWALLLRTLRRSVLPEDPVFQRINPADRMFFFLIRRKVNTAALFHTVCFFLRCFHTFSKFPKQVNISASANASSGDSQLPSAVWLIRLAGTERAKWCAAIYSAQNTSDLQFW